jgi:hypothetical protein
MPAVHLPEPRRNLRYPSAEAKYGASFLRIFSVISHAALVVAIFHLSFIRFLHYRDRFSTNLLRPAAQIKLPRVYWIMKGRVRKTSTRQSMPARIFIRLHLYWNLGLRRLFDCQVRLNISSSN